MHHVVLCWDGRMGRKPTPLLGPFFEMRYLGSHCLVSQKATPRNVTAITDDLGKWGEVIMSERGGCERKSPASSRRFYRELLKGGKNPLAALQRSSLDCGRTHDRYILSHRT